MRILQFAPYSPVPPVFGGALRTYHLLKGLAGRHDVTFVTFGTGEDSSRLKEAFGTCLEEIQVVRANQFPREHAWWRMLRALGNGRSMYAQYTISAAMQAALDRLYAKRHYDVTLVEFPHMGIFRLSRNTVTVLDEHNIEYYNFRRMFAGVRSPARKLLYLHEYRKTYREELSVCKKVDAVLTTSQNDLDILEREACRTPKFVVPNGVDMEYFAPAECEPEPFSMVFTGTMDYLPNQDATIYFLNEIFPLIKRSLPGARVYIVGKNPPDAVRRRASADVVVTGYVDDVRPYVRRAAVSVVPLRMGSGTRLKILEALAMRKAVVTTSIGCEGIDVRDGIEAAIADRPELFAEKVVNLLRNGDTASRLGRNGYELAKSRYDWDVVADSLDLVLADLVRKKAAAGEVSIASRDEVRTPAAAPPQVKVLMYHRVVNDRLSPPAYSWIVTESQFRAQLAFLAKWGYSFITFRDYLHFEQGLLTIPRRSIILTFDDGYEGIHRYALPIMREFCATGTAFVLGDRTITTSSWDEPAGFNKAALMDDAQILDLHDSGIEIGSHSMAHPNLTRVSRTRAWEEIVGSKESLEKLIQAPVITFAYPYGASNPEVQSMVLKAQYRYGCGVYSGPPKFASDRLNMRRIPITRGTSEVPFALKVLTPYEYYQWLQWEAIKTFHGREIPIGVPAGEVRKVELKPGH